VSPGEAPATARVQRVLPAPPELVYDAWVRAESMAGFLCPPPGSAEVTADPRIGGSVRIVMSFPDRTTVIEGEYLTFDRPHSLSFSWRSLRQEVDSVVTVTFEPHGVGETLMTITHSRLPQAWRDSYQGGWGGISERLQRLLGGRASG
jgi:uncharacterized protein YndB with AHSA1/START domain